MMIHVELANRQALMEVDECRLCNAVRMILDERAIEHAEISVAVVDDPEMQQLHRDYLGQDSPTDVLSFLLQEDEGKLDGQVVASAETAIAVAGRMGWTAADELMLYVVHGTLHLVGYDDTTPEAREVMRARERHFLAAFGLQPRDGTERPSRDRMRPVAAVRRANK